MNADQIPTLPALRTLGNLADVRPTIITDTREQTPLRFTNLVTVLGTLTSGDYAPRGLEHIAAIERKSAADLVSSVTHDRDPCGGLNPAARPSDSLPPPAFYNEKSARAMLGGISRTSLYRELIRGNLIRVPGMRKILITRQSIENWRC